MTTIETETATSMLASRAVLAGVTVRMWNAEILDRKVTAETNARYKAESDAGKYRKALVRKESIEPVRQAATRIRQLVYSLTLPWTDEGLRVLPSKSADRFTQKLKEAKAEFDEAANAFVAEYPEMRDEAKERLGDMFNESDYPDAADLRRRFAVEPRLVPIPTANDFRCRMGAEALDAARKALEASNKAALRVATLDAWRQARQVVATMAEKLKAYSPEREGEKARGIFRDSLVTNVIETALRLPNLNLAEDARMTALADRMESELCYFSADDLRRDDAAREKVAIEAERIVSEIDLIVSGI